MKLRTFVILLKGKYPKTMKIVDIFVFYSIIGVIGWLVGGGIAANYLIHIKGYYFTDQPCISILIGRDPRKGIWI